MEAYSRSAKPDIQAFTILRGFAAWWVVLYHVRENFMIYWPPLLNDFASKGYLAVDFFFLLSGFVIQLNYGEKRFVQKQSLVDFWVKRLARIYPLHAFSLVLVVIYSAALVMSGRPLTANYDMSHLWMQVLLIHNWGFSTHLAWNVPSWSISTEWGAYLFFPFWLALGKWHQRSTGFLLLIFFALAVVVYLLYRSYDYQILGQNIMALGLWRCILQFSMGNILCIVWQRHRHTRGFTGAAAMLLVLLMAAALIFDWPETAYLPLLMAAFLGLASAFPTHLAQHRTLKPLIFLGDASYATYLLHYVLFIYWKALFWNQGEIAPLWHLYAYAAALLASSALTYVYFEKPTQKWILALWSGASRLAGQERAGRVPW